MRLANLYRLLATAGAAEHREIIIYSAPCGALRWLKNHDLQLRNPSESLHHLARDVAPGPIGVNVRPAGADRRQRDRTGLLLRDAVTSAHHFGGLRLEDSVAQLEAVPRRPHLVGLELHPYDVPIAVLGGFNGVAAMLIALF